MIEDVQIAGFSGWMDFQFSQSIDEPAAQFSFNSSDGPSRTISSDVRGRVVEITSNGDLLLTGYVDKFSATGSSDGGRSVSIAGRSKTADIIDSQTVGTFRNQSGKQIIEKLIAPYGIKLETDIENWTVHRQFVVESGSTVMRAIYNVLRMQQASAAVTRSGDLQIWSADNIDRQGGVAIGGRVKSYSVNYNDAQRFSEFSARAQDAGFFTGRQAAEISGVKVDGTFARYRTRMIYPRGDMDDAKARDAAERAQRRSLAKGIEVSVRVTGWRDNTGAFYTPNRKIFVNIPAEEIASEMVIKSVTLSQSLMSGTEAQLTLAPVEAYSKKAKGKAVEVAKPAPSIPSPFFPVGI